MTSKPFSEKAARLNEQAWLLRLSDIGRCKLLAEEALALADEAGDKEQRGLALRALASAEEFSNNPQQAIIYLEEACGIFSALGALDHLITCNNLLGKTYMHLGDLVRALELFQQNARLAESTGNPQHKADALLTQGVAYIRSRDLEKALKLFDQSLQLAQKVGYAAGEGRAYMNSCVAYIDLRRYEDALACLDRCTPIFEQIGQKVEASNCYSNYGVCYTQLQRYEEAEHWLLKSREVKKSIGDVAHLINNYITLAEVYRHTKRYAEAEADLREAERLCQVSEHTLKLRHAYKAWYELCEEQGRLAEALDYFKRFYHAERSVNTEERRQEVSHLQIRFQVERIEQEKEIFRRHNLELSEANAQILQQKQLIEEKNKNITDSIRYARRIQEASLPGRGEIEALRLQSFIFFRPKDIVSGDFYWLSRLQIAPPGEAPQQLRAVAAVDCTGHGVPGALMTLVGNTLLKQAASLGDLSSCAAVLDHINRELPNNLKKQSAEDDIKDGMDMVLCAFDEGNKTLHFAGANNPIYLIRNNTLTEIKGDKQPISGSADYKKKNFTDHRIPLQPGDCVYLFTDGYPDQFGGPHGKKFKHKQLQALLLRIHELPMEEQKRELERVFDEWKGELEQVDDVLVIGVRI